MTEVLQVPRQPDGQSYYQTAGPRRSPPSSSSLFLDSSPLSSSPKNISTPHAEHQERLSGAKPSSSLPPSATSSYETISSVSSRDSSLDSFTASSRASSLSLDTEIELPNYHHVSFGGGYTSTQDESSPFPAYNQDPTDEPPGSTTDTTRSDSPLPTPTVSDDTAIKNDPSRQVDFLSHDWREEDIWASWRHIVSQRKSVYGERSRLENASWRTWAKTKFDLRTVSPERLNWLKESDVTWLYGPLKTASSYPITQKRSTPNSQLSKNNSFISKKPILKKRSVSEVMLQKSLSTSSLVKTAASAVQAQGRHGRRSGGNPDGVDSKLESETPSRDQVDYFTSRSTSNCGTPCEAQERKHIRFDDRVEQCIAVDHKYTGGDEEEESDEEVDDHEHHSDDSSDDGIVMMKPKTRPSRKKAKSDRSRSTSTSGRKIIETLPATTLKYRTDSPDVTEEAQHHTFGRSWNSGKQLSPSPSQETLRPSHPSSNFLLPEEDDDEEEEIDSDSSWSFGASNPKSSLGASTRSGRNRSASQEIEGMRRTASGMFMPYDDEDEAVAAGLFGRVSETFNTARDIAHVIWNVGWRK